MSKQNYAPLVIKMKSVTFGKNVTHNIENISDYIRNQTFHVILGMVQTRISIMMDRVESNKRVSISERLLVIEKPLGKHLEILEGVGKGRGSKVLGSISIIAI